MFLSLILDLLFPRFCVFCGIKGDNICDKCLKNRFEYRDIQTCFVCKREVAGYLLHKKCREGIYLDGLIRVVHYCDEAKRVLKELKYDLNFDISKDISKALITSINNLRPVYELIVPVPLHRSKKWKRGFNQSELLAKHIGDVSNILERKRNTKTQVGMNRKERRENLKDVFQANNQLNGEKVLLVDDVMTTGTTLKECAKELKRVGAGEVIGLVWASD